MTYVESQKSPTESLLLGNDVELSTEALDQEDVSSPERSKFQTVALHRELLMAVVSKFSF